MLPTGLDMTLETFPRDGVVDYKAFNAALESFKPGDAATIFTPGMDLRHTIRLNHKPERPPTNLRSVYSLGRTCDASQMRIRVSNVWWYPHTFDHPVTLIAPLRLHIASEPNVYVCCDAFR